MGRMPLMAGLLLLATLVVPQAWAGGATWSELSYPIGIEKHLVRSAPQVEIHSINEAGHINYGTLYRSGHTHGECGQCAAYRVCLLYTSPSPRDATLSRMPSSA